MSGQRPMALQASSLWFAYRRDDWVLKDVSLSIPQGSFAGLVGPSGSGKTTLLKILAGYLRPQRGSFTVLGSPINSSIPPAVRRRVGYIPQQLGLVRSMTALDNALMGALGRAGNVRSIIGLVPQQERALAMEWLARLGIKEKANEMAFRLSGGQRQRVAIARTLVQKPAIILADEFVSDLDQQRAAEIMEGMKAIAQEQGITFVCTMHEMPLVERFASQVIILRDGRVETVDALSLGDLGLLEALP